MTPEQIKAKSLELAALYTAKGNGKTLQIQHDPNGWTDSESIYGPTIGSDLSRWRVKPEPRTMWEASDEHGNGYTKFKHTADEWKAKGYTVTEWQEVLP